MAYLTPPFKHDVFLSYARVDDQKLPGTSKGWVSLFHEHLEIELSKRFGRVGIVKIWRDTRELGGSTYFDEEIQSTINNSGLFLALTSRGYLATEGYCEKELRWFHQKAQTDPYGLKVGTKSRLFNLFLQNISREELPIEFAGTSGLPFHDAQRADQFGVPSHQSSEGFEGQMRQLVDEIEATLRAFKKDIEPVPPVEPEMPMTMEDSFTIFLAHTEGSLRSIRRRVIEELRQNSVRVVTDIPPPYPAIPHEQRVTAEISNANLSVHLLDDAAGTEIDGDPNKSYYQKHVEIGRQHASSQMIWIPKTLDLQTIEDENHRRFLDDLENGSREQATYSFIRESPGSITREILAKVGQLRTEKAKPAHPPSAALLDTHLKDQLHALDLSKFLLERSVLPYITPEEDDPQKSIALFQEMLKRVSVLIIIFGKVAGEWVRERLISALQIAIAEKCTLKLCGIYLAPVDGKGGPRQVSLGVFPVSLPVFVFDKPEALADLLDRFLGR